MIQRVTHLVALAALAAVVGCSSGGSAIPFDPNQTLTSDDGDDDTGGGTADGEATTGDTGGGDTGDSGGDIGDGTGVDGPIASTSCGNSVCEADLGENSFDCPVDCPVDTGPATCANLCGAYNVQWTCQCEADCVVFGDCCEDYQLYCPQGVCGDGACGHDENVASCAQDCAGSYQDTFVPCLEQQCGTEWSACGDYPGCMGAWSCLTTCGPDLGCVDLCEGAMDDTAKARMDGMLDCGKTAGCFSEQGAIDVICGDGECEVGEFASTCPEDCKKPGASSCKDRCGAFTQNAPCQCDASCEKYGECCADFEALCL
jgi:hypothetical protein